MPKTMGPLAAALLLAGLVLAGCTAAPEPAVTSLAEPVPTATESSEPLVAETPAADTGDAQFLAYVRENLPANTVIPSATDEQLLAAGAEACERLRDGEASDTISVVEGEEPNIGGYYLDSAAIITGSRLALCTDQG